MYRTFPSFVQHADRLLDPVPITAKSRRILELTFAGLEQARIYGIHEPAAIAAGLRQLTRPASVRRAFARLPVPEKVELDALVEMLAFGGPLDENLRQDLTTYVRDFFRALNDPATTAEWVSDLFSTGKPMLSLRDVEQQAPVFTPQEAGREGGTRGLADPLRPAPRPDGRPRRPHLAGQPAGSIPSRPPSTRTASVRR